MMMRYMGTDESRYGIHLVFLLTCIEHESSPVISCDRRVAFLRPTHLKTEIFDSLLDPGQSLKVNKGKVWQGGTSHQLGFHG